jgi:hypothetical protein
MKILCLHGRGSNNKVSPFAGSHKTVLFWGMHHRSKARLKERQISDAIQYFQVFELQTGLSFFRYHRGRRF